ncbi:hypothetical protein K8353_01660 [Burkholderia contaminans]|nr:hypothetical protein [Burkholderia contaminans]
MISWRNYSIYFAIKQATPIAKMTRDFDEEFSNLDRHGDTPFPANARFILPALSGTPGSDFIAEYRAKHASEHRPGAVCASAGSTNKKACAVRSRDTAGKIPRSAGVPPPRKSSR